MMIAVRNTLSIVLMTLAFFVTPAMPRTLTETDRVLIDTTEADFGQAGLRREGKPSAPALIHWWKNNFEVTIHGALFVDGTLLPNECAKLVVEYFDRYGTRIYPGIEIYEALSNRTTTVTKTRWESDCLSNVGTPPNAIGGKRIYEIRSHDSRIHTISLQTKYWDTNGTTAGNWKESKRYCSDHDGVNGYRIC